MTKREEYDQLAAQLKADWERAAEVAKAAEERLRELKTEIEDGKPDLR